MASLSAGCSFFYDLNTTQCERTADCEALFPQFEDMQCVNRVCVERADATGGRTGSGGEAGAEDPVTTGGSVGQGGSGGQTETGGSAGEVSETGGGGGTGGTAGAPGTGGSAGQPECEHNSDCIDEHNAPYICRNGRCVRLLSLPECPHIIPDDPDDPPDAQELLRQDGAIVLGAFTTMGNDQDYGDTQAIMNWELAIKEFNDETGGGLPGFTVAREKRPLVAVVCQGIANTPEEILPGMTHLGVDIGVPAVLSTLTADKLIALFDHTQKNEYTEAGGKPVLFFSTGDASIQLAKLEDNGLVWHELGDPRMLGAVVAGLVERIEPYVRAEREANFLETGVDDPATPLRVTLVYSDHVSTIDLKNVLTSVEANYENSTLKFNGGTLCTDQAATGAFRVVEIESSLVHTDHTPDVLDALTSLQEYPPHIIVAMATDEFPSQVIPTLEEDWGAADTPSEGMQRPYYVLAPHLYGNMSLTAAAINYAGSVPPLHERIVGVNYASAQDSTSKALYTAYLQRLEQEYQDTTLPLAGTENFYDAAYHVLYSAAAAYAAYETPDGEDLRDAFTDRVISANPAAQVVNIGPLNIAATVTDLETSPISLWATMGPPRFDRISGTPWSPMSAWCIASDFSVQADGLIYDYTDHSFDPPAAGTPECLANY